MLFIDFIYEVLITFFVEVCLIIPGAIILWMIGRCSIPMKTIKSEKKLFCISVGLGFWISIASLIGFLTHNT